MNLKTDSDLEKYLSQIINYEGWMISEYSRKRQFFTYENACHIQGCIDNIKQWEKEGVLTDKENAILIASLIQSFDNVANTAGTYYAYLKEYYRKAKRPFKFKLLEAPVLGQIRRLIAKLKKKHTQITVVTGRTYYGAKARMQELGIDVGMPVALYNGGVVVEYGTSNILYASYIPNMGVRFMLNVVDLEKSNIYVYVFSTCSPFTTDSEKRCVKEEVYVWG
ncbi:MAG: HAD hydrolase family protein [Lachnospira sp.]|nr:HAD hydrolase family protein [Lachnospira sp.]